MAAKPSTIAGYSQPATELAERVLLEVWSRLGDYRPHLVLVGGLVPRYLVPAMARIPVAQRHCGTMDVDLGISLAVAELETYRSIRDTLVGRLGFRPAINARGRQQRHSFVIDIEGTDVNIDFLTTRYQGPGDSLMREVENELSAIQVEGLGLALNEPLEIALTGQRLAGGITTETIRVCRPVPYLVLKALAYERRREPKDAYDLVYVLTHHPSGPAALAAQIRTDERTAESFQKALVSLRAHYASPNHDGPTDHARFVGDSAAMVPAFAAVQEFLR
jgi:hypothetical protein